MQQASLFQLFLSLFSDLLLSANHFSFRFPFLSVSGGRRWDQGTAGEWVHVASVQPLAAGSGLGDDEGLQASRRRSRWLPAGRVRSGEGASAERGMAPMVKTVGLWPLKLRWRRRCCMVRPREDWEEDSGGCRRVRSEEERNGCGAGLLCQWAAVLSWPRGRTTARGGARPALGAKITKQGNGFGEEKQRKNS